MGLLVATGHRWELELLTRPPQYYSASLLFPTCLLLTPLGGDIKSPDSLYPWRVMKVLTLTRLCLILPSLQCRGSGSPDFPGGFYRHCMVGKGGLTTIWQERKPGSGYHPFSGGGGKEVGRV